MAYPPPLAPLNAARPAPTFQPSLRPPPQLHSSAPLVQAFVAPQRHAEAKAQPEAQVAQPSGHEAAPKSQPAPAIPKVMPAELSETDQQLFQLSD